MYGRMDGWVDIHRDFNVLDFRFETNLILYLRKVAFYSVHGTAWNCPKSNLLARLDSHAIVVVIVIIIKHL